MYDDGIHITPFNMKEEMEDGFFDADGNYFEKKDPNKVEDSWLQGVDWDKVEKNFLTSLTLILARRDCSAAMRTGCH